MLQGYRFKHVFRRPGKCTDGQWVTSRHSIHCRHLSTESISVLRQRFTLRYLKKRRRERFVLQDLCTGRRPVIRFTLRSSWSNVSGLQNHPRRRESLNQVRNQLRLATITATCYTLRYAETRLTTGRPGGVRILGDGVLVVCLLRYRV
jgi:hypothetical protein